MSTTAIEEFVKVNPHELYTAPPFSDLFRIRPSVQESITTSMREEGFDPSKPINVWRERNVVVDGHTRLAAAKDAGVEVCVCFQDFEDEDAAMDYAIANQRNRRNLTDAELAQLVIAVDKRKQRGGDRGNQYTVANLSGDKLPTHFITAELTGTSPAKVSKVRAIFDHAEKTGDTEERDAVLDGKKSINMAANDVKRKRASTSHSKPKPSPEFSAAVKAAWEAPKASIPVAIGSTRDDDARAFAIAMPTLIQLRNTIEAAIGQRSPAMMGHFQSTLFRLASTPEPKFWTNCSCTTDNSPDPFCKRCKGFGYTTA